MSNFLKNLHPLLRRKKDKKDNEDVNYAIIDALDSEMKTLEYEALESKLQSSLKTSSDSYLDRFGDWFGVYRRDEENDEDYRARIIKYLLLKRGTNNAIIEAIKDFLNDPSLNVNIYEPFTNIFYTNKSLLNGEDHLMGSYYRFAIIDITIGGRFPDEIIDIINEFKPAGVKFFLNYDPSDVDRDLGVLKVFTDGLPKVSVWHEIDRFIGWGYTFYGHIQPGSRKKRDFDYTGLFRTNFSKINSLDVLSGSSTVGSNFYNYAYKTSYDYSPSFDSGVGDISKAVEGRELSSDFYIKTVNRDNVYYTDRFEDTNSIETVYTNYDLRTYLSYTNPSLLLNPSEDRRKDVSDYLGEMDLSYYMLAVVPPTEMVNVRLEIFDFVSNTWVEISNKAIQNINTNIGSKLGHVYDYLNSNLNMFTRIIFVEDSSFDYRIDYIDLSYKVISKEGYSIKVLGNNSEYHTDIDSYSELKGYNLPKITDATIMSKTAQLPVRHFTVKGVTTVNSLSVTLQNGTVIDATKIDDSTFYIEGGARLDVATININVTSGGLATLTVNRYQGVGFSKKYTVKDGDNTIQVPPYNEYGIDVIDYSSITPMSDILLEPFMNKKLKEFSLDSQEDEVVLPRNFFNTVDSIVSNDTYIEANFAKPLKDVSNGGMDNSTGEIVQVSNYSISSGTEQESKVEIPAMFTYNLTTGSRMLIDEVKQYPLTIKTIEVNSEPKVVSTYTEST